MKKIINIILLSVFILCLIVSLRLSTLPVCSFLPEFLKSFFTTSKSVSDQYNYVYDLTVGYIISYFFYCVVELIPDLIRKDRAKLLVLNNVNILMEYMELLISIVLQYYKINIRLKYIAHKDLLIMDGDIVDNNLIVQYKSAIYSKNNKRITGSHSFNRFDIFVKNSMSTILDSIKHIENFERFYDTDSSFMEIIRSIQDATFIAHYKNNDLNPIVCFLYSDASRHFYDFIQLYLRLKKLRYNSQYSKSYILSDEECKNYLKGNVVVEKIAEFQTNLKQLYDDLNICIVYNSHNVNSKIVMSKIKHISTKQFDINSFNKDVLKVGKITILIVDKRMESKYRTLIKALSETSKIIVLFEYQIYLHLLISKITYNNLNVQHILPYKSSVSFCNFIIMNKNHPEWAEIIKLNNDINKIVLDYGGLHPDY